MIFTSTTGASVPSASISTSSMIQTPMLAEQETSKIFSWLPYRSDWPVDRNQRDDNIKKHYGGLINSLTQNKSFDTYYSEDGGLAHYLEFICYPDGYDTYEGNGILVCVSLCSPLAAYGQTTISKRIDFFAWGGMFSPDTIGIISDTTLIRIEREIKEILGRYNLQLIDKDFASKPLPTNVAEHLKHENHNDGNQYLHGLFQKTD